MLYLARRRFSFAGYSGMFDVRCVRSAPPARKRFTTAMAHRVPADVRDTFMRHDRNHSGRLDYRELRNTLEALSLDCTTSHAANILRRFDRDGNGVLDRDEVLSSLALWTRLMKMAVPEEPASGFSQLCAVM